MSLAVLKSRALAGMEAPQVIVEVHLANGLPGFTIVGLPDTEVREAKDRVRAALQNANFSFPNRRITVNLAPADLPKESGRFDLPIALGILAASGQISSDRFDEYEFAGELSLSGELRPIRGALAMTYAMSHHAHGNVTAPAFILPWANAEEAALVGQARILPARSLLEVATHFMEGEQQGGICSHNLTLATSFQCYPDFAEVKGQMQVKRALEIAASGCHNALLIGSPGTGKSMMASRFPGILPPMQDAEALETAALYSLGPGFSCSDWKRRPFRSPHHTASAVALVGGGGTPRPGEISLAHHGVLFLDELPEFQRKVIEALREPLESGRITISRAARVAEYPARFQLIAAMNPCPCGYLGHPSGKCHCTAQAIQRYQSRISGPLLDRIDLQLAVPDIPRAELEQSGAAEASLHIQARVVQARQIQMARQGKPNNALGAAEIEQHCVQQASARQLLLQAMAHFHWSARVYHRVLKVARSIADLESEAVLQERHIAEAVSLRRALPAG